MLEVQVMKEDQVMQDIEVMEEVQAMLEGQAMQVVQVRQEVQAMLEGQVTQGITGQPGELPVGGMVLEGFEQGRDVI